MQSTSIQDFQQQQGIVANFIYKVVELATYTSDFADDAINILTGNTLNSTGGHSTRQNYENVYDHKKKDVSTWDENVETVEDEESPQPYDNSTETNSSLTISTLPSQQDYPTTQSETKPSFTITTSLSQQDYPTTQTETKPSFTISTSPSQQDYPTTQTETKPSFTISTSPSQQDHPTTQSKTKPSFTISTLPSQQDYPTTRSTPTHSPTNSTSRRRQFRVRRGCRFVRRKSSSKMSNNFNKTSDNNDDDDEDIILKRLNSKISVMIAEAEAALNNKDKKYSELENRYYATVQQNKILSYQEKSYYEHEGMEAFRHNNNRNCMEIDNKEKAKEIENVKATIVQVEQELEIASITEEQTTTNGADASIHRAHSANSVKYYAFFILLI
ncbi:hypothetical protein GLOIN_2v1767538 [Rhizophagus irregularis DAOM 181602=DAOM 197198]|nr:hypothetical protein GLOIN_2v1767538 [Rhizophagus irregularis DAOM 181602=DAOM 197198]